MFENFANRKCNCPLIENFRWKISIKKMDYAPHQSLSATAGCRSCLKRQFGKKSPPRGSLRKRLTVFAEKNKVLCIFSGKRKSREQGANFDFKQFVTIRYETRDARRTSCYTRNEQNIVSAIKNAKLNAENIARYFPADSG